MKVYFAGNVGLVSRERRNLSMYGRRLYSYFYILPDQVEYNVFNFVKEELRNDKIGDHREFPKP